MTPLHYSTSYIFLQGVSCDVDIESRTGGGGGEGQNYPERIQRFVAEKSALSPNQEYLFTYIDLELRKAFEGKVRS